MQEGGWCNPPWVFLSWTPHRAEIFHSLWGIFCATFGEKNWSGHVRSRSYDVIRGTTFDKISVKSWENATWRGANDLNGDSWWDWCQYMTRWDLWHCTIWVSRSTKVTWGHWPRLTSNPGSEFTLELRVAAWALWLCLDQVASRSVWCYVHAIGVQRPPRLSWSCGNVLTIARQADTHGALSYSMFLVEEWTLWGEASWFACPN